MIIIIVSPSQYFLFNDDLPPPTSRERTVAFVCGAFILLSFAVALALSFSSPCSGAATSYGAAQGVLSSVSYIIMQMPQILVTWRTRASASLSLITVFLNAAGGFLVAYVQVFASQERWSTYLPNLVRAQKFSFLFAKACFFNLQTGIYTPKHHLVCHGCCFRFEIACAEEKNCGGRG